MANTRNNEGGKLIRKTRGRRRKERNYVFKSTKCKNIREDEKSSASKLPKKSGFVGSNDGQRA